MITVVVASLVCPSPCEFIVVAVIGVQSDRQEQHDQYAEDQTNEEQTSQEISRRHAGHVTVEDRAIIGGLSAVHQFVKIGNLSIVGGCSKVVQDVPPFMMVDGHPARVRGLNLVGIDRANISIEEKREIKKAYKLLYRSEQPIKKAVEQIAADLKKSETVKVLLNFLDKSERGICKESKHSKFSEED